MEGDDGTLGERLSFFNILGQFGVFIDQLFEQTFGGGIIGSALFRSKQRQRFFNMSQRPASLVQLIVYQTQVEVGGAFIWIVLQGL